MNETNIARFNKRVLAIAVASCMAFVPWGVEAAGLGKLTVFSGLGQPLRAELDVSANKDELLGMSVRLAQRDAFKQAGIEYSSVLGDLRFNIDKRPSGQTVIKLTSLKPLNEPFVDFLLELDWPSGRLVREYTFLLDPPDLATQASARSVVDAKVVETVRGTGAMDNKLVASERPASRRPTVSESPSPMEGRKPAAEVVGTRVIHHGDTLQRIAGEMRMPGVSLEQMLIGLFRNNPDAFVGKSIHRLKEGAILSIPQKDELEAIPPAEARRTYLAQAQDWHGYRQKLAAATAGAPAKGEAASAQSSSGKISAKLEDKTPPAERAKDQVKVARTDAPAKGPDAVKSAGVEEDRIARDKAYKEAQERLATLEKNIADLQKLLEMKNQKLAELQQAATPKKDEARPPVAATAPVAPRPAVEAAKPVESAAKPVEPPKSAEVKPAEVKPAEVKPAEVKPAEVKPAEVAAQEVKPPVPKPAEAVKPKRVIVPPPPPPEPDLIDSLLEDPVMLFGGAGGLLALLGLGGFAMYRRRGIKESPPLVSTAPVPSSLGPNSVFRMTGGQSVDTANIPLQTADFSQTGAAMIDTDEVDPVAEADVYIAYGRDTQAEEILLDALNKDPQRTAIHAKLLEIYAARGSLKQFETLASELYAQTDGQGPDWAKVAALGVKLDPNNPLYFGAGGDSSSARNDAPQLSLPESSDFFSTGSSAEPEPFFSSSPAPSSAQSDAPVLAVKADDDFSKSTLILPSASESSAPVPEPVSAPPVMTLDFDLGVPEPASGAAAKSDSLPASPASDAHDVITLDFDLGSNSNVLPVEEPNTLDFDLNVGAAPSLSEKSSSETDFSAEGTMIMPDPMNVMDASFDLGALEMPQAAPVKPVIQEVPKKSSEMSLDFDFDMPPPVASSKPAIDPAATVIASAGLMAEDDGSGSLDFDVDLGASMFMTQVMEQPKFDITTIDLDLAPSKSADNTAEALTISAGIPVLAEIEHGQDWEEANTKLDLAKAYEEMGDADGASELLREIIAEAPADLVEQAKAMLVRLGA